MINHVMGAIGGNWRHAKSLQDAKRMADIIIDYMDPEWVIRFGLELLQVPEATEFVLRDWTARKRPALRQHLPYFTFLLSINLFFYLALGAQLLRNVKSSHQIDLAYLYYLPFCAIFIAG